eukprot:316371-Alexandrium_andersonii.AAC.1
MQELRGPLRSPGRVCSNSGTGARLPSAHSDLRGLSSPRLRSDGKPRVGGGRARAVSVPRPQVGLTPVPNFSIVLLADPFDSPSEYAPEA